MTLAPEQVLGLIVLALCVGWILADLSKPRRRAAKPSRGKAD